MSAWLRSRLHDIPFWLLNGLVVVVSFYVAQATRLFVNIDGLSYISLARLYAEGDFVKAINTHWSPFLSWLLIPVVWISGDLAYWGKVLIGVGVVPSLVMVRRINADLGMNNTLNFFVTLTGAIVLLHPAMVNFTPDILLVAPILFVIHFLHRYDVAKWKTKNVIALAAVAATGYSIKHFMLAFFLVYVTVVMVVMFATRSSGQRMIARRWLQATGLFLLLILPWVICISVKTSSFTFSSAASYNRDFLANPDMAAADFREKGLIGLPYPEAYSYWDDPATLDIPEYSWWKAFGTAGAREFQFNRISTNYDTMVDFLDYMLNKHGFTILIVWCLVVIWFLTSQNRNGYHYLFLFFPMLLYCGMYIFIVDDYRYNYFPLLLLVMIAGKLINDALKTTRLPVWMWMLIGVCFVFITGKMSAEKLSGFYHEGLEKTERINRLAEQLTPNSNHCNAFTNHVATDLMYVNGMKYFGKLKENASVQEIENQLRQYNIRYVFAQQALPPSFMELVQPVIENDEGLWVYETNELIRNSP